MRKLNPVMAWLCLTLFGSSPHAIAAAPDSAQTASQSQPVEAMWKVQEVNFFYNALTTFYACDPLATKVEQILEFLGAHKDTRVRVTGCPGSGPSRTPFVSITAVTPVETNEQELQALNKEKGREELIKRLGGKTRWSEERFRAVWRQSELSRERSLHLQPGDCELLEHLSERVFPKLGIRIIENDIRCTPNNLDIKLPKLEVAALTKAPDADKPGDGA